MAVSKIKLLGRRRTRIHLVAAAAAVTAVIVGPVVPAVADTGVTDVLDASAMVQQITPELLKETETLQDAAVEVKDSGNGDAPTLTVDPKFSSVVGAVPEGGEASTSPTLDIQPTYATDKVGESAGMSVWKTSSESAAAYVQPIESGVRVFTAIADRSAPTSYDYALNVPDGTTLRPNAIGYMILAPTGDSLGQILSPWAKDARGVDLPTQYNWADGKLTQTVDLSDPSIKFPVLMDPAWTYTHRVDVTRNTPAQVRDKLKRCFNCYFPVEGAPRSFPSFNQFLPLVVRPFAGAPGAWNFNCYMQNSYFETSGNKSWFGYWFKAAASHVDGAGSTISFDFNPKWNPDRPSDIFSQLVVSAYIVNDNPVGSGQPLYTFAASANWNVFASALIVG